MLRVCVHHPLNPELSKECLRVKIHMPDWITTLKFPFSDNRAMADRSLNNLLLDGVISEDDLEKVYSQVNGRVVITLNSRRLGATSFKVCIHYPFNPLKAKQCMQNVDHMAHWIGVLEIPFLYNEEVFSNALVNMAKDGVIEADETGSILERSKQDREGKKSRLKQGVWLMPTGSILNIDVANTNQSMNLNLNDPRIAEINIKYRD